jgi:hypothetical protein
MGPVDRDELVLVEWRPVPGRSVAAEFAAAEASGQDGSLAWYGDSAYGTGELRAALAAGGQQAVIKPGPLRPAVPGGFTIDDFAADHAAGSVTCPAGITRRITRTRAVTFGAACRGCPLRRQCTTARDGRALTLHEHDALLRAARAEWPAIRDDYRARRPNVERAVAQVATQRGRRLKLRYRGVTPNDAWLRTRTAALNLRNLIGRGLTRHDGTWLLAT